MRSLSTPEAQKQLTEVGEKARGYAAHSVTDSTRRCYQSDWRHFEAWCAARGLQSMPATGSVTALYITDQADHLKVATLERRLATISRAHKSQNQQSPTSTPEVRAVMSGIRRDKGTSQAAKVPVLTADLRAMVAALPDTMLGIRDRALLLVGFAGALRRSELVALDVEDCDVSSEGVTITLRRSKTDQEARGARIGIPFGAHPETCPVKALCAWVEAASISEGPLFRRVRRGGRVGEERLTAQSVALVVKRAAASIDLDPSRFAGHSLRAGLATSAAANGASERAIMRQTRHRSVVVARRYIREGSLYRDNAAATAGL